jgi:hypothetical protein
LQNILFRATHFPTRIPFSRSASDKNFRVRRYARHESTIGASNISLWDRPRVTSFEMRKPIRTRHKFRHRQTVPLPPYPPSPRRRQPSHPLFPGGRSAGPLLNLWPINQTIPYKFVTREIARIPRARARYVFPLPLIHPVENFSPAYPTPSLSSARVYRRFRAHF